MSLMERILFFLGGLFGLAGITAASAAAHITGPGRLDVAANMLLFHAPALIAVALAARVLPRMPALGAGVLIAFGTLLFSGELTIRAFWNATLFPMAAPTGGTIMMVGWAVFAITGLIGSVTVKKI